MQGVSADGRHQVKDDKTPVINRKLWSVCDHTYILRILSWRHVFSCSLKVLPVIYSSTVESYDSEILALYSSVSLFCYFKLALHYILGANIVLSLPLYLFSTFSF